MSFLKAFFASACGWRSLLEEMGNTLGKSGERRGVMLEFEKFPPVEDYKKAFIAISCEITNSHKAMLRAHYHAPAQIITATGLAKAAGYENFGGANLQYARIAELIANHLNYLPPERDDNGKPFWSLMLASGYWKSLEDTESATQREWQWQLREQVSQALEDLGWV